MFCRLKKVVPELSVVILSFNQYDLTTGPCLNSLSRVDTLGLEIIVVDNASDDMNLQKLTSAASQDSRIKLILNKVNRGFAGGNNDGVAQARAGTIVLLNSDTRVLPESLPLLVRQLESMPDRTILGPATNSAGNEQQIYFDSGDVQFVLGQGALWSSHAQGSLIETDQLSFFCVVMRKETYLGLGGLDESFSLGFYEDTDFCCRAIRSRVNLQIMEEAFVYHAGSASFSRIPETTRKLLKENGQRFRKKNGRVKQIHSRYKNLNVLHGYIEEMSREGCSPSLSFRFHNRLCRAKQLATKNPLKQVLYEHRLNKIIRLFCGENGRLSGSIVSSGPS